MKSSKELLKCLEALEPKVSSGLPEFVEGFSSDSRKIKKNYVFSVLKGHSLDGSKFIAEALAKGARVLLCEEFLDVAIPQVCVKDLRKANAKLARFFHDDVCDKLKIIAITGTNGKSSTAYILQYILNGMGEKAAIMGTLGQGLSTEINPSALTTPGAEELHSFFEEVHQKGAKYVVLEASSHGLDQMRLYGLAFEAVLFTNLSEDHLQYHGSMEEYFDVKKSLFEDYYSKIKVVNADDTYGTRLLDPATKTFSESIGADCVITEQGVIFNETEVVMPKLLGDYNLYNAAGAILLATELLGKSSIHKIKNIMLGFPGVPGRLEVFEKANGAKLIVDFAHSQEALEKVIGEVRKICLDKLFLVFGCGGDRDRSRRYGMGLASDLADEVTLTNDNPRSEEPSKIIEDILSTKQRSAEIILGREQAIRTASSALGPGDCLIIAGKGHEQTQIYKDHTVDFCDRDLCRKIIEEEKAC
ncbi:UDP-N-acetylmuramoyl-L-alanyl-D-glutamate--2,6-diaminopimelate ligase [Lentisphaera profundi]|uniref:UDP-N-acetylmuramoyl-L-alanyl-D-glutamate--2,6-diaminopimelate ligase n=1 Tax=Lentisphaera profundi TaxID=1658616 RepID=A0ABY7VNI1_9BACT|nr:UDP-N-acetylmuramoyl-L-alanyl-D-glutamate--2,6-diaminopimelate ligase [Lentisphaera profundi]WDE95676.1 UDP-N-acetylmuramoyl-L-alanyl-D-glutamate--2,6-diaminopimelate ligase [Lentisphaera profundi]